MIHVSDPTHPDDNDKLGKIRILLDHMVKKCKELYQASLKISVDERMVKSRGRFGFRQFIPAKPVRYGFKLWCICDAKSAYTIDFRLVLFVTLF